MVFNCIRVVAPMASWGGVVIDAEQEQTHPIPTPSWLTGLIGAALGVSYRDPQSPQRLQDIQDGLEYGIVVHRPMAPHTDYQTADLSLPWMTPRMDSTGVLRRREYGSRGSDDTVIQHRHYWTGVDLTILARHPELEPLALDDAFASPVYPLYLGRSCCLPARSPAGGTVEAASLEDVVLAHGPGIAWLPAPLGAPDAVTVGGVRDWKTRRFGGVRGWLRISIDGGHK